jgi:hypothetical protein
VRPTQFASSSFSLGVLSVFLYISVMKAMVITPKSQGEFKFISDLLKKLGISSATMTEEELEDIGLSKLLKSVDKTKKVSKNSVMQKLK